MLTVACWNGWLIYSLSGRKHLALVEYSNILLQSTGGMWFGFVTLGLGRSYGSTMKDIPTHHSGCCMEHTTTNTVHLTQDTKKSKGRRTRVRVPFIAYLSFLRPHWSLFLDVLSFAYTKSSCPPPSLKASYDKLLYLYLHLHLYLHLYITFIVKTKFNDSN